MTDSSSRSQLRRAQSCPASRRRPLPAGSNGRDDSTYAGYDVVDIELDGDVYRVKAFEPAGKRVELRYLAEDASFLSVQDGRSEDPFDAVRD